MSIADKLNRLSDARDDIITALAGKGVTATGHGFEDFPTDIGNISQGGGTPNLQTKSVTPLAQAQQVRADNGYDGLDQVNVGAVSVASAGDTIVPSTTIASNGWDDDGTKKVSDDYAASDEIIEGMTYTVTFAGTDYLCTAGISSDGKVGVGSLNYTFTDFPFFIRSYKSGNSFRGVTYIARSQSGSKTFKVVVAQASMKYVQAYLGYATVSATSYTATAVTLTVQKTGTYKVSWMGWRNTNSGTSGSQLYKNGSAVGSANTTFQNTYGQSVTLTNQSFNKGDVLVVRARSRSTSYVMGVGNLIIEGV